MGIIQLIMGYQSVKRILEMGACQIGVPVKWNTNNLPQDIYDHSYEQSVIEKGKINWHTFHIDNTKDIGEEPEYGQYKIPTITNKDYDKNIEYLDNYYKVSYSLAHPGKVNGTPDPLPKSRDPPTIIIPQTKNPLNKDLV